MSIEDLLRDDLWGAIKEHYAARDYAEAVRDAFFFTSDFIRDLSGLDDKDGSKLIDAAFLGNNPALLINNNETTTEKDVQQGIGFAFKGLMLANRNPFSHEKTRYTEEDANAVILYINYLLNRIDQSTGIKRIGDIMGLLCDEDFTPTEEYADLLLKKIPAKKRYDLMIDVYRKREALPPKRLRCFIARLFDLLTKQQKNSFFNAVSNDLMRCKDDEALRKYIEYFFDLTFADIDKLPRLRIEDLILTSLKNGEMISYFDFGEEIITCNKQGALAVAAAEEFKKLSNYSVLLSIIHKKLFESAESESFIFNYFRALLFEPDYEPDAYTIELVRKKLLCYDKRYCDALFVPLSLMEDQRWMKIEKEYDLCLEKLRERER